MKAPFKDVIKKTRFNAPVFEEDAKWKRVDKENSLSKKLKVH